MRSGARLAAAAIVVTMVGLVARPADGATSKPKKAVTSARKAKSPATAAAPSSATEPADPRAAQAEQGAERDRLTARIAELKKQIAAGERSRSGAAASLKRAEQSLALVNRRLAELAQRQRESQDRIAGLDLQRAGTEGRITARQVAFGETAARLAANQDRDPMHDALVDGEAGERSLTEIYLQAIAWAEAADLDALHGRARDLQAQRQKADDDARALVAQAQAQQTTRESLAADQAAQRKSLAQISEQLAQQRTAAAALAADEQRLTRVVEQLQRMIDRQAAAARAQREKREAAKRQAEERAEREAARRTNAAPSKSHESSTPPTPTPTPPPAATVDSVPDATSGGGAFAHLRGSLRLPVRGALTGRFGAPRGTGGGTWKGVFVRTESGVEVHAVAAGKVVFADELRGFGNLVIVDHGDQYLSIYGNNESLQKRTGDLVKPGDVLARTGNSSGDEQTGLYFELRYQGRPFDPMTWTGPR